MNWFFQRQLRFSFNCLKNLARQWIDVFARNQKRAELTWGFVPLLLELHVNAFE